MISQLCNDKIGFPRALSCAPPQSPQHKTLLDVARQEQIHRGG